MVSLDDADCKSDAAGNKQCLFCEQTASKQKIGN